LLMVHLKKRRFPGFAGPVTTNTPVAPADVSN
jgi:hypothetical protein